VPWTSIVHVPVLDIIYVDDFVILRHDVEDNVLWPIPIARLVFYHIQIEYKPVSIQNLYS
jgi:hypothetical protein